MATLLVPTMLFSISGISLANASSVAVTSKISVVNCVNYQVKPLSISFSCADGGVILSSAKWSKWTNSSATGQGKLVTNLCVPTCVAGKFKTETVKIFLSKVKMNQSGKRVFSAAKLTFTGKNSKGKKALLFAMPLVAFK